MFIETPLPETLVLHVGTFSWKGGNEEFSITVCPFSDLDPRSRDEAIEDYNSQLTERWEELLLSGKTGLRYTEVKPCLLF